MGRTGMNFAKQLTMSAWMRTFGGNGDYKNLWEQTARIEPEIIPLAVCKKLIKKIDELADQPNDPRVWQDRVGSDTRIHFFEEEISENIDHFELERHIKAIDDYVGSRTKSWFLMANRVLPKDSNLGSGGGLHRDSPFSHQVKCIWYLNDVTGKNGPFQYVPGTNANTFKTRKAYPLGQTRFSEIEDTLVEAHAKAGSLLICDTKCIHGGKPIESGARYAVTLYTFTETDGRKNFLDKISKQQ